MTWNTYDNWLLPELGTLKLSYVRAMYDQTGTGGKRLSHYYRDGIIVNTNTYVANTDAGNPVIENNYQNKAKNVPTTGTLKLSHFRNVAMEYRETVNGTVGGADGVTINNNTGAINTEARKRIVRYYIDINGKIYTTGATGLNGKNGLTINFDRNNIILIVHNKGIIYGGPGQGDAGGSGGGGGGSGGGGGGGVNDYAPMVSDPVSRMYRS